MSVTLQAPLPLLQTTTFLPNPELSDVESHNYTMDRKRTKTGVLWTYVNDEGTGRLSYTFTLTRMKSYELRRFLEAYMSGKIKLTNHKGEVWEVYLDNNPFEVNAARRGAPVNEIDTVQLIFQGVRIS